MKISRRSFLGGVTASAATLLSLHPAGLSQPGARSEPFLDCVVLDLKPHCVSSRVAARISNGTCRRTYSPGIHPRFRISLPNSNCSWRRIDGARHSKGAIGFGRVGNSSSFGVRRGVCESIGVCNSAKNAASLFWACGPAARGPMGGEVCWRRPAPILCGARTRQPAIHPLR